MRFLCYLPFLILVTACSSTPDYFGSSPHFIWPVNSGRITQEFRKGSSRHDGVDISGRENSLIKAAADGTVIYAGNDFNGYGKLVIVEHQGDRWASFYAHLNGFKVKEGQRVYRGQNLGLMGKTGRATGVHLHFEIRYNKRPVDPLMFVSPRQQLSRN
ncbi:MAG: M23 family metallopeptidase [Bdellovibrionales bacterium]|nr:M23 family metallopeptidase [Bdellovibrionales bacterium]